MTDAQRLLVTEHLPLVDRVVRLFRNRPPAVVAEVRSAAHEALTAAARDHDPAEDDVFPAFAWRRVFDAAQDAAHGRPCRPPHIAAARRAGLDMAAALRDETSPFSPSPAATAARHVEQSLDEVAAAFALDLELASPGVATGLVQQHGEDGLVLLEDHVRKVRTLGTALASLAPPDRRLFELRCRRKLPARRVAEVLGVSKATVDRRLRRVLSRLRAALATRSVTRAAS